MRTDMIGRGPRPGAARAPGRLVGATTTVPLRVGLFGPLQVSTASRDLDAGAFPGVKPKQLLEVLLCERGHRVSKSRLAETLWGDALPQDHVATLETYVCVLRRTLDPGAGSRRSAVVTENAGYRIGPAGLEVDLDRFDQLRQEAVGASPAAALERLGSALTLVRGQVLEDEPYAPWAQLLRDTYRDRAVQAMVDAARLSLVIGDPSAAMALGQRAVELNPLSESAYRVLMIAAYALWRQDEALAAFDRCRRLLADELGADPMEETADLHLAILRHEPVAELVLRLDAGVLRAPAVTGATIPPQRSVAQQQPGTDRPAPPQRVLLGRERELSLLQEALGRAGAGRLTVAVVTGHRGFGKTALVERLVQGCGRPVAAVRCSDVESTLPYLALSLALRGLPPRTGERGRPALDRLVDGGTPLDDLARLRTMEAFAGQVTDRPPFVLWLDDAQWADHETVATLGYLQRRCPDAPLLVVLTCDRSRSTLEALHNLSPYVRVDLGPLPEGCVGPLGDPELFAVTAGQPWLVDGWLQARHHRLPEQFPSQLCERVLMACWDAGPRGFRLLSAAAGLDRPASSASLLAALLDTGVLEVMDELDHLVELGLLTWVGQEVAFGAPAVQSIVAAAMAPVRRSFVQQRARELEGVRGAAAGPAPSPVAPAPTPF